MAKSVGSQYLGDLLLSALAISKKGKFPIPSVTPSAQLCSWNDSFKWLRKQESQQKKDEIPR
ncbi:hypothetical protein NON20_24400 (plasmid) [Synechocystis sp. B12]|nr:hypothetical protein NON20_24400 [Synechocystis sp. B12]